MEKIKRKLGGRWINNIDRRGIIFRGVTLLLLKSSWIVKNPPQSERNNLGIRQGSLSSTNVWTEVFGKRAQVQPLNLARKEWCFLISNAWFNIWIRDLRFSTKPATKQSVIVKKYYKPLKSILRRPHCASSWRGQKQEFFSMERCLAPWRRQFLFMERSLSTSFVVFKKGPFSTSSSVSSSEPAVHFDAPVLPWQWPCPCCWDTPVSWVMQ